MLKNKATGRVEKGPEMLIFPSLILEKKGIHIDVDSMVKYTRDSDELKAILKFVSKPENKFYINEKYLLEISI